MARHLCVTHVPLFSQLPEDEQQKIEELVRHQTYQKGELVFQPGSEELDIVARGSLRVYQLSPSGKEQLLRVVRPGGYEGESRLFGAGNDSLFGEAREESEVCRLSKRSFNQMLLKDPAIALRLFELSSQKWVQTERQVQLVSLERVEQRIAAYLLDLVEKDGTYQVTLPLQMKDIAKYLGTTPETLSRKFRQLEDDGLIARSGRKVTILDADALLDI
jgi:CRP/FNR family transcriptional regulator